MGKGVVMGGERRKRVKEKDKEKEKEYPGGRSQGGGRERE